MKKFVANSILIAIAIIALSLPLLNLAHAEGEGGTDVPTDTDIDVSLSYETQDPGSKEFNLVATITSQIDSGKVLVDWKLPQQMALALEGDTAISRTTLKAGETKTVTKRVRSKFAGKYTVEVKVTAIKADFNYITTDKELLEFNPGLEIIPLSKEYKQAKLFRNVRIFMIWAFVLIAFGAGAYFAYKKIRIWVNTPG